MKTLKIYNLLVFVIILIHFFLVYTQVLPGDLKYAILIDICLGFIFMLPVPILYPLVRNYSNEKFTLKFLTIITIQILLILAFLVALKYLVQTEVKYWLFSTIIVYVTLLCVLSVCCVKIVNKDRKEA